MSYKIGEVSKLLDIPVETLRFYDKNSFSEPEKLLICNYSSMVVAATHCISLSLLPFFSCILLNLFTN